MEKPGKKRPEQHRIDTEGLKLFEKALPNSKAASFVFTRGENDYGIDGEIQIVINEIHTGEFFKVQIKSKKNPTYIESGKLFSLSLDINTAYFLVEEVKNPTALVVVDTKTKKVFWHPIQTDPVVRANLEESLGQDSMTIHIDTAKILTPKSYQEFYDDFRKASERLSQREVLQTRTNKTLGMGMKFLSQIERKTLEIEGFTPNFRNTADPVMRGTVFTVGYDASRVIDYVSSKDFRPDLAPKINIKTTFSTKTKEGRDKAEAFQNFLKTANGSVELNDENISSFEVTSGDTVIDDKAYAEGGVQLKLSPSIEKRQGIIFISDGDEELQNTAEIWFDKGRVHIESTEHQVLSLSTNFEVKGSLTSNFKINISSELLKNASHELRLMNFFRSERELTISFIDPEGFKRKLFSGTLAGNKMISDESYEFVKALTEIEKLSGIPIPYPLPNILKRSDVTNVFWVHKLLTQGKVTQNITFSFSLKDAPPKDLQEGGVIYMTQSPPEIYLFNKPYVMNEFKQAITGTITNVELDKKKYKVSVQEAEISIIKDTSTNKN